MANPHLGSIATVYQCELFVIHTGFIRAIKAITNPSNIVSQAAIKAHHSPQVTSQQVLNTINHLNKLGSRHQLTVRWVPGHENKPDNKRAPRLFLLFPGYHVIRKLLFRGHLATNKQSDISKKCTTPFTHFLLSNMYHTSELSGSHTLWLTLLFTGHNPLNYLQYRSNNFLCPTCTFCRE